MSPGKKESRRHFLKKTTAAAVISTVAPTLIHAGVEPESVASFIEKTPIRITVNEKEYSVAVEPGRSLLDLLREQLGLTGTKKGCDMGHCGACIVLVNGERVNACLSDAVENNGNNITTIEGLAREGELHPLQEAFIKHDAFQCGYCTPGQIMSGVACLREGKAGSADEIREYMNGNICRCGAYPNIVAAILDVKESGKKV